MNNEKAKGFTLIEILVVVTIVIVIAVIIGSSLGNHVKAQALEGSAQKIASLLEKAKSKTLAGESGSSYGIHFASSSVTLFTGTSYSSNDPQNEIYPIDGRLVISVIELSGGASDVVFRRLTGGAEEYGTITLMLLGGNESRSITIEETGAISVVTP